MGDILLDTPLAAVSDDVPIASQTGGSFAAETVSGDMEIALSVK